MDCNCQSFLAVTTRCACRLLSSGGVSGNSAVSAFDIESIQEQYIESNDKKEGAGDRRALKLPLGSVAAAKKTWPEEKEREQTRCLRHHNSTHKKVFHTLGNMRVFRAKWKHYHFSIHGFCYK